MGVDWLRRDVEHDVYRCFDADGALLYIGATNSYVQRMSHHRARRLGGVPAVGSLAGLAPARAEGAAVTVNAANDSATLNSELKVAPRSWRHRTPLTPAQVDGIRARAAYYALPWWQRLRTPRPPTWAQTTRSS